MSERQIIKVKPNKDNKIIITLFGQEYEIIIEKESDKSGTKK